MKQVWFKNEINVIAEKCRKMLKCVLQPRNFERNWKFIQFIGLKLNVFKISLFVTLKQKTLLRYPVTLLPQHNKCKQFSIFPKSSFQPNVKTFDYFRTWSSWFGKRNDLPKNCWTFWSRSFVSRWIKYWLNNVLSKNENFHSNSILWNQKL